MAKEKKTTILKVTFYMEVPSEKTQAGAQEQMCISATNILRLLINEDELSGTVGFGKLKTQVRSLKDFGKVLNTKEVLERMRTNNPSKESDSKV